MTGIEKRFAGNGDEGSLIERQLLNRASVKREARTRPTHIAIGRFQRVVSVTSVNLFALSCLSGCTVTHDNRGSAYRYCNHQAYWRR